MPYSYEDCQDVLPHSADALEYRHPFLKPLRIRRDLMWNKVKRFESALSVTAETLPKQVTLDISQSSLSPHTFEERFRDAITAIVYNPQWNPNIDVSTFVNYLHKFHCGGSHIFTHNPRTKTVTISDPNSVGTSVGLVTHKPINAKHPYILDASIPGVLDAIIKLSTLKMMDKVHVINIDTTLTDGNRMIAHPDMMCQFVESDNNHLMGYNPQ